MGEERTFSIALDEDLADMIDDAVTSGGYASSNAVVQEALAVWQQQRMGSPENIERLRQAWADGLASGEPIPATDDWFDDIKRRGHARLEAWRATE